MVSRWTKDEFSFFKYMVCHTFFITLRFSSLKSVLRKMKMCLVMPQRQKLWEWCRKRSGPLPWDPSWGGGAWGLPSLEVSPWSICWKASFACDLDTNNERWKNYWKNPISTILSRTVLTKFMPGVPFLKTRASYLQKNHWGQKVN